MAAAFDAGLPIDIYGDTNDADMVLGNGDDIVVSGFGNDTISTAAGNDIIFAGRANDTVDAGAGNDWIRGGAGSDVMTGGSGSDTFAYSLTYPPDRRHTGAHHGEFSVLSLRATNALLIRWNPRPQAGRRILPGPQHSG